MPCMCGDAECPSCGLAQGTLTGPSESVAFRCPSCGEDTLAALLEGHVFASPELPALECECGALWSVGLYEVEKEAK